MKTMVLNIIDDAKFNFMVTLLQEFKFVQIAGEKSTVIKMKKLPNSMLHPIEVENFKMFSRDELYDK